MAVFPLAMACAVLASESVMPQESYVRMNRASEGLLSIFLLLQIGAGWLLTNRFAAHKARFRKLLWTSGFTLAAVLCSFIGGLAVSILAERRWVQLAEKLFL